LTIYTGKIDEYYGYKFGRLPYRSLDFDVKFEKERSEHAILNYTTKEKPYTRVVDYGHLTYNHSGKDSIRVVEYPKQCGGSDIPFYPMPFGEGVEIYKKYKELADKEEDVIFLGRLATYKYLDMWMAVKQVMNKITSWCNGSTRVFGTLC
jgi:UDP-galactopyranose mutase